MFELSRHKFHVDGGFQLPDFSQHRSCQGAVQGFPDAADGGSGDLQRGRRRAPEYRGLLAVSYRHQLFFRYRQADRPHPDKWGLRNLPHRKWGLFSCGSSHQRCFAYRDNHGLHCMPFRRIRSRAVCRLHDAGQLPLPAAADLSAQGNAVVGGRLAYGAIVVDAHTHRRNCVRKMSLADGIYVIRGNGDGGAQQWHHCHDRSCGSFRCDLHELS